MPALCVALCVWCPGHFCSCSPACLLGVLCCVYGILDHSAPVHWCARSVRCVWCAVSWGPWLLFTIVLARCVVLGVLCPGPIGSISLVCSLSALCWVCGVLSHLAPVHRCARSACCVWCAVSWATWLLITGVLARRVVLRARCPWPLAPVHRCACPACCVGCAVLWATWLRFTGVLARCVVLCVAGHP